MKKHVIGRVPAHKEPVGTRISRLHIPARIFCLVLAIVLWLAISALTSPKGEDMTPEQSTTQENQ